MAVVGDEQDMSADEIFMEMWQEDLIPRAAIPKWEELGIELGFSYGEIETISQNATQKPVQICAMEMLSYWRQQAGAKATPEKLIEALRNIDRNSYAAQLRDAVDGRTYDRDYLDNRIARDVAPYWHDLGIQLGVRHLDNIKATNNPTEHRFNEMLLKWLDRQTCSKHEVYKKLYKALVEIHLNAAASELKNKVHRALDFYID